MRKFAPFVAAAALVTAGGLWLGHPHFADAQVAGVGVAPVATADTVFVSGSVDFEKTKGTEASKPIQVSFQGRSVLSAEAVLKGFDVQFDDAEHPVHETKVKLDNVTIDGETVKFTAHALIRDNSGNIDDAYTGHVDYVVIARVK